MLQVTVAKSKLVHVPVDNPTLDMLVKREEDKPTLKCRSALADAWKEAGLDGRGKSR